jgi:hypothetical protein
MNHYIVNIVITKDDCSAKLKDSGFGWKLEDFEFRAAFIIIQHFHFFEEKNLKKTKEIQNILQKIRNGGIKF